MFLEITNIMKESIIQHFFTEYYVISTENPYFYLWIIASIMSSCFTYTWDVKLDWGLFDSNAGENKFLREEIVYSSPVSLIVLYRVR